MAMDDKKTKKFLLIGLFGAILTLFGDLLIGCVKFPEDVNILAEYFAAALELPTWRPVLGGYLGFLGISLEVPGLLAIAGLFVSEMPKGASFYKFSSYVYLAVAGGAVHFPCGIFMWLFHTGRDVAGEAAGYELAFRYMMYFLLPVTFVFGIFFIGSSFVQFFAFLTKKTAFPRWYCLFNLLIFTVLFNMVRLLGNTPLINGIATSNKSLGAIIMFAVVLAGYHRFYPIDVSRSIEN